MKAKNRGMAPARRAAIVCISVGVVALLLAAAAVPVFAASKKSSGKHNGETTSGETTSGNAVSPDATNSTSDTHEGDTLTNAVVSPSPIDHVAITLKEDSRHACCGATNTVDDQLPSGFDVTSIKAPKFNCTGEETDAVSCQRKPKNTTRKQR